MNPSHLSSTTTVSRLAFRATTWLRPTCRRNEPGQSRLHGLRLRDGEIPATQTYPPSKHQRI